jgi:hypothetical protein
MVKEEVVLTIQAFDSNGKPVAFTEQDWKDLLRRINRPPQPEIYQGPQGVIYKGIGKNGNQR